MDLAAVFLLSLLGGYCFAYVWRVTAFTTRRIEGHHLYFRAALCGAMFFSIALALRLALIRNFPAYQNFDLALVDYLRPALKEEPGLALAAQTRRVEWVVTTIYSLLLGTVCGAMLNHFTPRRWALRRSVSAFYNFLLEAQQESTPVSLTLNTGKVYIGFVVAALDPIREPVAVTMLPMLSGNRDAQGRLNLTTDYETVYSTLEHGRAAQLGLPADWPSQFELTIRADEIVTAAPFSPAVYAEFNPDWKQRINQRNQPGAPLAAANS
jgi:hypothetical protein